MKTLHASTGRIVAIFGTMGLLISGCSKSDEQGSLPVPENPTEAATQVEQVFQSAPPEVMKAVQVASEGLREGDYEKAALSLQAIRSQQNLTFEQGMAVYNSMVTVEAEMIAAMQAGDPQAKQAYERLKRIKRN